MELRTMKLRINKAESRGRAEYAAAVAFALLSVLALLPALLS